MADRHPARRSLRTAVVERVLREAVEQRSAALRRPVLDVLDVGGGTGGFAVPLALLGHRVTVIDPSPDALAALTRRAAEAGLLNRIRALQGDMSGLHALVGAGAADVIVCHGVLEHVDDLDAALAALAAALRPDAVASVLVAQRLAVVLARAVSGRFAEAHHALTDPDGRWGPGDPLPRRVDLDMLTPAIERAGLAVRTVHGVRVVADLVPGTLVDLEPGASDALLALEEAVAEHPVLAAIASQVHLLVERS